MDFQGEEDHYCRFCDFKFAKKSLLECHMRKHTREKPFFCDQCQRRFSQKHGLSLHIRIVHEGVKRKVYEKKYKCLLCTYETPYKSMLEAHTRVHSGERIFPCQHPDCQYSAKSSSALRGHNRTKHKNERAILCPFPNCRYRGNTPGDMKQHLVTHSEKRPFVCDFEGCSYRSKRKQNLQQHKIDVHHAGFKPYACAVCNYRTTTRHRLSRHELSHNEEKPVICDWSGCVFSCKTNSRLTLHVMNCHREKKFKCDIQGCHSTSASLSRLEYHKKKLHYNKAHKCPNCKFRTAVPSLLQAHIFCRHHATKRIPCPTNGCTFLAKHRWTLNQHMQYHEANLGCPLEGCGFVAHSSSSLKQHMQLHDPTGRPFPCPFCPKHFSLRGTLSQHLKTHTQEKPFQCPACNFGTVNKGNIMRHVGLFHPNVSSKFDHDSICDHCSVNFGCAVGLARHRTKLKTAVVVLTRLQLIL